MTPEQLIERVKSLGVEFWQPSETLEAMLKQTEAARIMRIDRLKDFVRINADASPSSRKRSAPCPSRSRSGKPSARTWRRARRWGSAGNRVANVMDPERQIRPRDTTFTELVEAMADAREKQGDPEPPALLDLRGLKVGTVCEADADFELPETGTKVHEGERFTVIQHDPHDDTMSARIEVDEEHWWSRALVPARVVEKGGEDAQG